MRGEGKWNPERTSSGDERHAAFAYDGVGVVKLKLLERASGRLTLHASGDWQHGEALTGAPPPNWDRRKP